MNGSQYVFLDSRGKRWSRVRGALLLAASLLFVALVVFARCVLIVPKLRGAGEIYRPGAGYRAAAKLRELTDRSQPPPQWLEKKAPSTPVTARRSVTSDEPVSLAFYAGSDVGSFRSLRAHYHQITHVAPEWFWMRSFDAPLVSAGEQRVAEFASSAGVKLLPMLSNLDGNQWQPEIVEDLARNPRRRPAVFEKLRDELQAIDAEGVLIDWEEVDPAYRTELVSLLTDLATYLHAADLELWLCIPVGNDINVFDLDALSGVVDRFVALLFDETGEDDDPGPIASLPWWNEWFDALTAHGRPEQWVAGIGAYGYDWSGTRAATIGFGDAMARAGLAQARLVSASAPIYQPHFEYEEGGVSHSVAFLDSVTFRNQYSRAVDSGIAGTALYRLGKEDGAVWKIMADPRLTPDQAEAIESADTVANAGEGDLLSVSTEQAGGLRRIEVSPSGLWGEIYEKLPRYPLITHHGGRAADRVVLSFDDGPDPEWTPRILDRLKAEGVHAVFFLVGSRAIENPDLVRRIVAEGHEIGNHSYSHPNLSEATKLRTVFELNATQRIIEGSAGVSTILFRPPYDADTGTQSLEDFTALARAQELGYLPLTESIDSEDWGASTADEVVERVKEHRHEGNVILLHDGGGDRSATVDALPGILAYLRARGDRIVSLQDLLGIPREALMPRLSAEDSSPSSRVSRIGLGLVEQIEEIAWAFALGVSAVLLARALLVAVLAVRHRRFAVRPQQLKSPPEPVSVLLAAYNESKVIAATVCSVLQGDYEGPIELIVVDDGSTDDTARIVADLAATDPRVRVLSQANLGKAHALDRALRAAHHEMLVMLDADTQFRRDTLRLLVAPLARAGVGAVSGHVRVGNLTSLIARFQALEYVCGFNLDRRAYDACNAITVVPGAASAFRKSAVEQAGGILADTLAEDTDLTLRLHRSGYHVCYAPRAVAYTEAPDNVRSLVRQRIRWAFGTLQCVWKHRDLLFSSERPGLGFFSLPTVWFCHVFLVALIPFVDVTLLASLLWGAGFPVAEYAAFYFGLEWLLALFACHLEKEPLGASLLILPMRVLYRPLLCIAVWTAILRALNGAWYGWGKLDRKGTVRPIGEAPAVSVGLT